MQGNFKEIESGEGKKKHAATGLERVAKGWGGEWTSMAWAYQGSNGEYGNSEEGKIREGVLPTTGKAHKESITFSRRKARDHKSHYEGESAVIMWNPHINWRGGEGRHTWKKN